MPDGIYDQKLKFPYEIGNKEVEILTTSEVKSILTKSENYNENRKIIVHTKVPDKIRLIKYRTPDFYIGDDLKVYRCHRDYNRPYEVNTTDLNFGIASVFGMASEPTVSYIFKLVICGRCSQEKLTQIECADDILFCPKCDTVFE